MCLYMCIYTHLYVDLALYVDKSILYENFTILNLQLQYYLQY